MSRASREPGNALSPAANTVLQCVVANCAALVDTDRSSGPLEAIGPALGTPTGLDPKGKKKSLARSMRGPGYSLKMTGMDANGEQKYSARPGLPAGLYATSEAMTLSLPTSDSDSAGLDGDQATLLQLRSSNTSSFMAEA